jgi:hypothetical protein
MARNIEIKASVDHMAALMARQGGPGTAEHRP